MSETCTFCQLKIASADPHLVVYQGLAAHRYCIIRNREQMNRICREANSLMALCRLPNEVGEWRQYFDAGRINSYDCLVSLLRRCFQRIDRWRQGYGAEGPYVWPTAEAVKQIQMDLGRRLFCDL